jgi:hypothetical protein
MRSGPTSKRCVSRAGCLRVNRVLPSNTVCCDLSQLQAKLEQDEEVTSQRLHQVMDRYI